MPLCSLVASPVAASDLRLRGARFGFAALEGSGTGAKVASVAGCGCSLVGLPVGAAAVCTTEGVGAVVGGVLEVCAEGVTSVREGVLSGDG